MQVLHLVLPKHDNHPTAEQRIVRLNRAVFQAVRPVDQKQPAAVVSGNVDQHVVVDVPAV